MCSAMNIVHTLHYHHHIEIEMDWPGETSCWLLAAQERTALWPDLLPFTYQPTNIPSQVLRPSVSWGTRGCSVNIFLVMLGGEWHYYDNACFNRVSPKQAQAPPTSDEATVPGARPAWLSREWSRINQSIFLELVLDSMWANNVTLAL